MIIHNGIVKSKDPGVKEYENSDFKVYFQGLIYIPYIESGIESIKKILAQIKNNKINDIGNIKGNFFIFIIDKTTGRKYFFIDNSGLFRVFIHNDVISTSLLELAKYSHLDDSQLDYEAIVKFLHFGFTGYFNRTFFKPVRIIDKTEIILYGENNEPLSRDKEIPTINQPIDMDMLDFFKGFYESVKEKKISLDLTGGIDSRVNVALFQYLNADYELAISGIEGLKDIEIPGRIARILNKDFFVTYHNIDDISDETLQDLFYVSDAQIDLNIFHRRHQLNLDRKKRGVDIQIGGGGGGLYKDILWLQDFPFYNKKYANIERFYDLRVEAVAYPHHNLGERTRTLSQNMRQSIIKKLEAFRLDSIGQTYDNILYNYKIPAHQAVYNAIGNKVIETYEPLLEPDLARLSFGLKRRRRFYNNFEREIITKYCPEISKIKTTENVSSSAKLADKLKDFGTYAFNKQMRLAKQILRKVLKKTFFQPNPNHPGIYKKVAGLDIFRDQLAILKDYGIIDKSLKIENISTGDIGKFLVIGLLLRELK